MQPYHQGIKLLDQRNAPGENTASVAAPWPAQRQTDCSIGEDPKIVLRDAYSQCAGCQPLELALTDEADDVGRRSRPPGMVWAKEE